MEPIKLVWILHLVGNILWWWIAGTAWAIVILLLKKDLTIEEKQVCYDIINFNLSFYIYFAISWLLVFVLIGFITFPIVFIIWLVNLIRWAISHIKWERFEYPFVIKIF